MKEKHQDIIKYAYSLTKDYYAFHYGTLYLQASQISNITKEEDYKSLDNWLKGIRQDYAKILVTMNAIEKIQNQRLNHTYTHNYVSIGDKQETEEIACCIEFLFTKYRSIFDYIYQVLLLCVPPQLNEKSTKEYNELKKVPSKYKFFLRTIAAAKTHPNNELLDMKWFKQIIDDRDYLIHDCASCLVFSDCRDSLMPITFTVWTKDAFDEVKNDANKSDPFYCLPNDIIDYKKYWGLQLAKLIVFFDTIFDYLKDFCTITPNNLELINTRCRITRFTDEEGENIPDAQHIIRDIFNQITH